MSEFETKSKTKTPKVEIQATETKAIEAAVKEITKPKYDPTVLLAIFDDIIFQGEYAEDVTIKNKLRVTFRTRSAKEISAITREIDKTSNNLVTTQNEQRSLLNLYYGLVHYQGKKLGEMPYAERVEFIDSLPGPIIGALMNAFTEFDAKVYAACQEGEENF